MMFLGGMRDGHGEWKEEAGVMPGVLLLMWMHVGDRGGDLQSRQMPAWGRGERRGEEGRSETQGMVGVCPYRGGRAAERGGDVGMKKPCAEVGEVGVLVEGGRWRGERGGLGGGTMNMQDGGAQG